MDRVDITDIRKECSAALKNLDMPSSCNMAELIEHLRSRSDRKIFVKGMDMRNFRSSGVWIGAREGDWFLVDSTVSSEMQEHALLHELGHFILSHQGLADVEMGMAEKFFPKINLKTVHLLLQRGCDYTDAQEKQAEIMAYVIGGTLRRSQRYSPPVDFGHIHRIETSLNHSRSFEGHR